MRRCVTFVVVLMGAACGHATLVTKTAESDSSCTRTRWWIEAPLEMSVGEKAAITIGRCNGWATPKAFAWSTSNWMVIGVVAADSDQVIVQALQTGTAKITAASSRPRESSAVSIKVN